MNAIRTLVQSEPVRVVGHAKEIGGTSWEVGIVEFENGVSLVYELPTRRRGNYWEIDGTEGAIVGNELLLYREAGTETYPIQTITTEVDGVSVVDHARVDTDPPIIWDNPLKTFGLTDADDVARGTELHSIYRAIVEGVEPEYGALNGRTDQEILIAIRESARNGGKPIDLPLTEITGYEENMHRGVPAKNTVFTHLTLSRDRKASYSHSAVLCGQRDNRERLRVGFYYYTPKELPHPM